MTDWLRNLAERREVSIADLRERLSLCEERYDGLMALYRETAAAQAAAERRKHTLREALERSPHAKDCASRWWVRAEERRPCDCHRAALVGDTDD